jgi:glycosyl transferase family 87
VRGPLLPVLLLVVLPGLLFAWRLGALRGRRARRVAGALAVAAVACSLPFAGVDFVYLKRFNLFLAAAAMALALARDPRLPFRPSPRVHLAALAGLATACLAVYLNFFSFHGERTFVHLHDVAHYYLGSKYFDELGYEGLYTAMLRAEAEVYENRFTTLEARDLATNELVHIRALLVRSDEVKAAFTPQRWEDWKRDVALFREWLGPQHKALFIDHGFNPTPLWPVLGGTLANLVPAGSRRGVVWLCLLDPVLLVAAFAAVRWAFGGTAALFGLVHFCLIFGASFGWTGGAFLRYLWFASLLAALCCLRRERHAWAGALTALAAALRVFPAFFVLPIAFKAAHELWRERRVAPAHRRFLAAAAVTGLGLFLAGGVQPRGLGAWGEFRTNLGKHMDTISPNIVGLTNALAYHQTAGTLTLDELRAERDRRATVYRMQLATLFLAALLAVVVLAPRLDDVNATLLAIPLLLTGLNLASYYYVVLVLLSVANAGRPRRLAALFGLELLSHALLLFEDRENVLFIYRSVLLLYLLAAFDLPALAMRIRKLPGREPELTSA